MDFEYSQADEAFREKIRAFMHQHPVNEYCGISAATFTDHDVQLAWERQLGAKGWLAAHWPAEYGGPGWTAMQREIFEQERAFAGAASLSSFGLNMLGPVLMKFGTDAQKKRFLPPITRGREMWCQGYSEPGSGSDLASIKTRAERVGEKYIVNGQKIWTTQGHCADWIFCLVRTSVEAAKQQGISFLLIDMRCKGVEIRPIVTIDGLHHLNEVFFTNVEVPVDLRVGEEGQGWTIAKFLLTHERTSLAGVADSKCQLSLLRETVERDPALNQDAAVQRRLDELEVDLLALEITNLRTVDRTSRGESPGLESSGLKIKGTELQQAIAEAQVEFGGLNALPWRSKCKGEPIYLRATQRYNFLRAATIYGGSNEIQRNVLGKSVAGKAA